jgi:hypothetical protein
MNYQIQTEVQMVGVVQENKNMYFLQKTHLLTDENIIELNSVIQKHISEGSRIDMVIPNKGMKNGWIIVYTPNK